MNNVSFAHFFKNLKLFILNFFFNFRIQVGIELFFILNILMNRMAKQVLDSLENCNSNYVQ